MVKPIMSRFDELKLQILLKMANFLYDKKKVLEMKAIKNTDRYGIEVETLTYGKRFWDETSLTKLFIKKGKEGRRFRL